MKSKTIISIVTGLFLIITMAAIAISSNKGEPLPPLEAEAAQLQEKEAPKSMPAESEPVMEPLVCLDCHRSANINTNEGVITSRDFCYDCHKDNTCTAERGSHKIKMQVTRETFQKNQQHHQYIACIECHTDVARSPHKTEIGAQCRECHPVHGEATAHAPHLRVTCQACHLQSEFVMLDTTDHTVKLAHQNDKGLPISLAEHTPADMADDKTCTKCHQKNNSVGAPASVLPSKSMICLLCHYSPVKMGSFFFGLAILIFLFGCITTLRFWYKGSVQGEQENFTRKLSLSSESIWAAIFSKQFFTLLKVIIMDIVLQKRILKESVSRWSMHTLIFSAILARLVLALFTLAAFSMNPDGKMAIALIDKNAPFTAFVNDLLGLFILIGILWAIARRYIIKPRHITTEYHDNIALFLIFGLVVSGFITEGARILVTGVPVSIAGYAFIGYPLSKCFALFGHNWWASFYPFLWYVHGIFGALFVAYLPFGKMNHMFNTPLTYLIETISGVKRGERV